MKVLVLYGTLTMNTEIVAYSIFEAVESSGMFEKADILNMLEINDLETLKEYDYLIIGTSTWSDGDYPPDTEEFMEKVLSSDLDLTGRKASFFGLGESSYAETFCDAIKRIQEHFITKLNVLEIGNLHIVDGYPEDTLLEEAKNWIAETLKYLR